MEPTLIILGASARAAAASAIRAGFRPWTADLFADVDLKAMVPDTVRCPAGQYPHGFVEILREAPQAPWIYTGGLENHPNLIDELSEIRPLWGNGLNELLAARSPFHIAKLLIDAGLPSLELCSHDGELTAGIRWLRKPLRGSAGQGISNETRPALTHYFQEFKVGVPMSAIFLCGEFISFVGVTEQLIGTQWLNAKDFQYAGNIGPIEVAPELSDQLERIGEAIGDGCKLRGVFGVDFILADKQAWVVEVNPRYTASIEVIEKTCTFSVLSWHAGVFNSDPPRAREFQGHSSLSLGKAIFYADRDFIVPDADWLSGIPPEHTADIPRAGEPIAAGWPILTVFSEAGEPGRCRDDLERMAMDLRQRTHK